MIGVACADEHAQNVCRYCTICMVGAKKKGPRRKAWKAFDNGIIDSMYKYYTIGSMLNDTSQPPLQLHIHTCVKELLLLPSIIRHHHQALAQ